MRLYGTEGQTVRVLPCLLLLIGLCLSGMGCNLFSKRPASSGERSPAATGGTTGTVKPPEFDGDPVRPAGGDFPAGSMLAGQVIDNLTGTAPAEATILVSGPGTDAGKPLEVTTNAQGYFTIENLKRGQQYKLWARAKQGDKLLAGITYASAPNIRVLVKISEDFVTPGTPSVPGAPAVPGPKKAPNEENAKGAKKEQPTAQRSPQWTSPSEGSLNPAGNASVGIGPPRGLNDGAPNPQPWQHQTVPTPQTPPDSTKIATGQEFASGVKVQIPPVRDKAPSAPNGPGATAGGPMPFSTAELTAVVPSCVLLGKELHNFALYDLNGQPWEYKKNRRGKVVLLDFWHTYCIPCIQTIPNLVTLQKMYGDYGLEVVGITYEQYGSPADKAQRVAGMARVKGINYQLLQGGSPRCPVREKFGVQSVPTLVLLDENGRIAWTHVGQLDRDSLGDLEWQLRGLLRIR
jgi:thiol-disulfide isomerase/thioredoxin